MLALAFAAGAAVGVLLYRIGYYHGQSGQLTYPGERRVRMFSHRGPAEGK